MEIIAEILKIDEEGNMLESFNINEDRLAMEDWNSKRIEHLDENIYEKQYDILPYYMLQNKLREKVIKFSQLKDVKAVAGVDVSYNEMSQKMIGAIVILNAANLEVLERVYHEMEITFPYIPGLFSFREIPPLLEAYKKLKIKPDLIVCDGHGIAHPKGVGMATHLGIELDVPTIGCAKSRLVGAFDKEILKKERGSIQSLIWEGKEVGVALRSQDGIKPVFISIGHKIDLELAINWVLKLSPKYRLPETTRLADQYVNTLMKDRTAYDILGDDLTTD